MPVAQCKECGGFVNRPGLFGCMSPFHPKPTIAQKIVQVIEDDFTDRRGLKHEWEQIDDELQREIRDEWARLIEEVLKRK